MGLLLSLHHLITPLGAGAAGAGKVRVEGGVADFHEQPALQRHPEARSIGAYEKGAKMGECLVGSIAGV
jgi:hypothetical protein